MKKAAIEGTMAPFFNKMSQEAVNLSALKLSAAVGRKDKVARAQRLQVGWFYGKVFEQE